jgi:hypothetical protein
MIDMLRKKMLVKLFVIYMVQMSMVIQLNVVGDVMNQLILEIMYLIMEVVRTIKIIIIINMIL